MRGAKCNKNSCLNAFNTSFMSLLSYRMVATQFIEQQWNKTKVPAIVPVICVTCDTAGMAKNFECAVLYSPLEY